MKAKITCLLLALLTLGTACRGGRKEREAHEDGGAAEAGRVTVETPSRWDNPDAGPATIAISNITVHAFNGPKMAWKKPGLVFEVPLLDGGTAREDIVSQPDFIVGLAYDVTHGTGSVKLRCHIACRVGRKRFEGRFASSMSASGHARTVPAHHSFWEEDRLESPPDACDITFLRDDGETLLTRACYTPAGVKQGPCGPVEMPASGRGPAGTTVDAFRVVARRKIPVRTPAQEQAVRASARPPVDASGPSTGWAADGYVEPSLRVDVTPGQTTGPHDELSVRYLCGDARQSTPHVQRLTTAVSANATTRHWLDEFPEGFKPGLAGGGRQCTLELFTGPAGPGEGPVGTFCLVLPDTVRSGRCSGG